MVTSVLGTTGTAAVVVAVTVADCVKVNGVSVCCVGTREA